MLILLLICLAGVEGKSLSINPYNLYNNKSFTIWPLNRINYTNQLQQVRVSIILPMENSRDIPKQTILLPSINTSGPGILAGFMEADRRQLLEDVYLNITFRNSRCDNIYSPIANTNAVAEGVDVMFGPSCEFALASIARGIQFHNVPLFTAGGLTWNFNKKKNETDDVFYLLTKTGNSFIHAAEALSRFMIEMNWQKLILIYRKTDRPEWSGYISCSHTMSAIVEEMKKHQIKIQEIKLDMTDTKYNNSADMLLDILPELNYSISVICASQDSVRDIMLGAQQIGVLNTGQYVFINLDIFTGYPSKYEPWISTNSSLIENDKAKSAFSWLWTISPVHNKTKNWNMFIQEMKDTSKYLYGPNQEFLLDDKNSYPGNFHDAALLYATALNETLFEEYIGGELPANLDLNTYNMSRTIYHKVQNRTIQGVTGPIKMNNNADRGMPYAILQLDESGKYTPVRIYSMQANGSWNYLAENEIKWPNNASTPLDYPPCGIDGICEQKESRLIWTITMIVAAVVSLSIALIGFLVYKHFKRESEIAGMHWKINPDEVQLFSSRGGHFGSKISLNMKYASIESIAGGNLNQIYAETRNYRGRRVCYTEFPTKHVDTSDRSLMLELKRLKEIQHDNVTRFVGACLDPGFDGDVCFILTEYCYKGSLEDVLAHVNLDDEEFKFSLMSDIVKGLCFLHQSEIRFHANLKSSNCVIDSRFAVKLTDFGLHRLRKEKNEQEKCDDENKYWKNKTWIAPELIHLENWSLENYERIQKGDIYSLALIFYEIGQYNSYIAGEEGSINQSLWYQWSPKDVVDQLLLEYHQPQHKIDDQPFRPDLSYCSHEGLKDLIQKCWDPVPDKRVNINYIKLKMKEMHNYKENITDNLMDRMNKWSTKLEDMVAERTQQYLAEKEKCEDLLHQLLPKSVAQSLIAGNRVKPKHFDCVTIYFSDIVGFTKISAVSSPEQVVHLLNHLYTTFDTTIGHFNVYKVETIGDAYMVVSGLPDEHDKHAREIASMSLSLLADVKEMEVPHLVNEKLRIRIGIHTGPCCAGVVGIKMPRYCLFGDTVNTASRMESNGLPYKIHVSQTTYNHLVGYFDMEKRGELDVKGKGKMQTYWVNSERQDCSDPVQPDLVSNTKQLYQEYLNPAEFCPTCHKNPAAPNMPAKGFDLNKGSGSGMNNLVSPKLKEPDITSYRAANKNLPGSRRNSGALLYNIAPILQNHLDKKDDNFEGINEASKLMELSSSPNSRSTKWTKTVNFTSESS